MTILYLVRHAKPAANWGESTDSGLDATGIAQAEQTATRLQQTLAPLALYTSPLRRCVETAAPLAQRWQRDALVFPEVAEIPSPAMPMDQRKEWLAAGMQGTWAQMQASSPNGSPNYLAWRDTLLRALKGLTTDSVIYSHYIAINVVVGAAQGNDRVISFSPGHASVTAIAVEGERFAVRELGAEVQGGGIMLGR
jgi:broad specificity phosphatase PhoE